MSRGLSAMSCRAHSDADTAPPAASQHLRPSEPPNRGWLARGALAGLVLGMLGACDGMSGLSSLEFGQWVGAPCAADTDCDRNTFCAPGIHRCEYQKDLGQPCQANNECRNDMCADGVCCSTACDGACEACASEGNVGTCVPFAAGTDPEDECPGSASCTGSSACMGGNLFALAFGEESDQTGVAVAFDSQGNVVLGANFYGTVQIGTEILTSQDWGDILLAKLDLTGESLWVQAIGGNGSQYLSGLVVDADDRIVIAGTYSGGMQIGGQALTMTGPLGNNEGFVAQLSDAGTPLWVKSINFLDPIDPVNGGGWQDTRDVAVDESGNVAVTGKFSGAVTLGADTWPWSPSNDDIYLAKLDSQGNFLWSKSLVSDVDGSYIETVAVEFDASGNLILGGSFQSGIDFGPPAGRLAPVYSYDVFLAKYNSGGTLGWAKSFGTDAEEQLTDLAVDSGQNILVTGFFTDTMSFGGADLTSQGDRDVFLAKLTPTGNHQWSKQLGAPFPQQGNGVTVGPNDDVVVTGDFTLSVSFEPNADPFICHGGQDVFLGKWKANGDLVWAQVFGGLVSEQGLAVAADMQSGTVALTGWFQDQISFGRGPLTGKGNNDGYLATFAP